MILVHKIKNVYRPVFGSVPPFLMNINLRRKKSRITKTGHFVGDPLITGYSRFLEQW
jgi:hypothetical protein